MYFHKKKISLSKKKISQHSAFYYVFSHSSRLIFIFRLSDFRFQKFQISDFKNFRFQISKFSDFRFQNFQISDFKIFRFQKVFFFSNKVFCFQSFLKNRKMNFFVIFNFKNIFGRNFKEIWFWALFRPKTSRLWYSPRARSLAYCTGSSEILENLKKSF